MTRFILKSTGRVYIALEHTVGNDIVYGRIEKNGMPTGKTRSFEKSKIEYIK